MMTEIVDYNKKDIDRYYKRDHLKMTFWSSFLDLSDRHCLNAGCGHAGSLVDCPTWHGFDFNDNYRLGKLWEHLGVSERTIVADARNLPYEDNEFEWTVSCDFLEHVKVHDLETVANELRRVAPHGRHIIDQSERSRWRGATGETLHPAALVTEEEWVFLFGGLCRSHEKRGFLLLDY